MSESTALIRFRGGTMPRPYSGDLRARVIEEIATGAARREAAERYGISASVVVIWAQRWKQTGSFAARPSGGSTSPLVTGGVNPRIDGEACSGEDKGAVEVPGLFKRHDDSERRIVSCIVSVITVGGPVLLAVLIKQLHAVVCPDAIAQFIKQFDDGEGLLWRPIGWNVEGDGERQTI